MDPRKILAESSAGQSMGPAVAALRLTLPYFYSGGRVDLVDNQTGGVLISVDISQNWNTVSDGTAPSVDSIARCLDGRAPSQMSPSPPTSPTNLV